MKLLNNTSILLFEYPILSSKSLSSQVTVHHLLGRMRIIHAINNWLTEAMNDQAKVAPFLDCMTGIKGAALPAFKMVASSQKWLYDNARFNPKPGAQYGPDVDLLHKIAKAIAWPAADTLPGPNVFIRQVSSMAEVYPPGSDEQWDEVIVNRLDEMAASNELADSATWATIRASITAARAVAMQATNNVLSISSSAQWSPGSGWALPNCRDFFDHWKVVVSQKPLEDVVSNTKLWKLWKQDGNCSYNATTGHFGPPGASKETGGFGCCRTHRRLHMMGETSRSRCCNL